MKFKASALVVFVVFFTCIPARASVVTLPIAGVTPGTTNPAVTQANIHSTICLSGYTKTIRPPASYTTKLKKQQLASTYSRYGSTDTTLFEEDHLIPLELGGNPTDPKNLWPEPWSGESSARTKDKLENALHALVCSGSLALKTSQNAIATNWYAAYQQYVLKSTATSSALAAAQELAQKIADEIAKTKAGMLPSATPTPINQASTFSMPMFYESIGTVRANWARTGFTNPPIMIQDLPPSNSFTCKPATANDLVVKQDPVYNSPVTSSTQVTLTVLCALQVVTTQTTAPTSLPTPTFTTSAPTPTATTPAPVPTPTPTISAPAPVPTPTHPAGVTGLCRDGTYSSAATHSGMCSGHGGVAQFYI